MLEVLWLVLAAPLTGFILLVLAGRRMPDKLAAILGCGSVGAAAVVAIAAAVSFVSSPPTGGAFVLKLWSWVEVTGFSPDFAIHLDALSLTMLVVITVVGFFIHLYSAEYMRGEEGLPRFFAYMNLFVVSMLILVLADNFFMLYLGWEGVGLCSFLLIGFWYRDPANGAAARKAFIVTRVGDTAMAVALFLIFSHFGSMHIQDVMAQAAQKWPVGSGYALAVALLLLGGAVGKSAQLPLQTWLPDAMAGPTPVSALIHAATMVTAGFYLIARTHVLFQLAPLAMQTVAWVGALTLLLAGLAALAQNDIKRVLAYSTISQIGYMFLALGVGAWSAAVFHFATHAVFKALLFLGAGAIIVSLHHEQDMFRMGGLRRKLPLVFWTFLAGAASLAALPLISSGFYSKDLILWRAWSSELGSLPLWGMGLAGALITALYTGRMLRLTFFGPAKTEPSRRPGLLMGLPLIVLATLSLVIGFVEMPSNLGGMDALSSFLHSALPSAAPTMVGRPTGHGAEWALQGLAALISIGGLVLAFRLYAGNAALPARIVIAPVGSLLHRWFKSGFGFDWLYDRLIVFPYRFLARINRRDVVDQINRLLAGLVQVAHFLLTDTQTGRLRHYAMGLAAGAIVALAMVVWS